MACGNHNWGKIIKVALCGCRALRYNCAIGCLDEKCRDCSEICEGCTDRAICYSCLDGYAVTDLSGLCKWVGEYCEDYHSNKQHSGCSLMQSINVNPLQKQKALYNAQVLLLCLDISSCEGSKNVSGVHDVHVSGNLGSKWDKLFGFISYSREWIYAITSVY